MIEIKNLKKVFSDTDILNDISVTINNGDVISIIGPSGTGKSTFLRCLNLLEQPTSGSILLDGEEITANGYPVSKMRQKVGMVFQSFNLFSHMNVVENIMYAPVKVKHMDRQQAYEKAMELLTTVHLADRAFRMPEELSGGQKQRVAICRALAMDPEVILFDEPTSALDPSMVGEVEAVIKQLSQKGYTMLIVTHEMRFAHDISNRVFYMDEGIIYEDGSADDIFQHPKREKTKDFIFQLKTLEGTVSSESGDYNTFFEEIERFCSRFSIRGKQYVAVLSVLEELILQTLLPNLPCGTKIDYMMQYSIVKNTRRLTARYGGEQTEPFALMDPVSRTLMESHILDSRFSYEDGMNKIVLEF